MNLPKLDLPQYELVLPVANKKLKYRPFVVKEEKNLLIAMQDSDPDVALRMVQSVVEACTFGEIKSFDDWAQLDMEYLFIHIRNKSMGEGVEITATCVNDACKKKTSMTIDLAGIKIVKQTDEVNPVVQLAHDLWVTMHYPSLTNTYKLNGKSTDDEILSVVATCLDGIVKGEQSYETRDTPLKDKMDWLQGLTKPQFQKINDYFESAPKMVYENEFVCKHCGTKNLIHMEGLDTFFV